jgi:hypothetical protein
MRRGVEVSPYFRIQRHLIVERESNVESRYSRSWPRQLYLPTLILRHHVACIVWKVCRDFGAVGMDAESQGGTVLPRILLTIELIISPSVMLEAFLMTDFSTKGVHVPSRGILLLK